MSGFLDHLFDPSSTGKKGRERIRYREKLRSLIQDAPAVRRLSPTDIPNLTLASFSREGRQLLPRVELVVELVGEAASADRFRQFKNFDKVRPIWRLDPIISEEQILETRAMGADAYVVAVDKHDQAMLQFLVEIGRDYGLPTILSCATPEDLAMALSIQDVGFLWLRGELHSDLLFDLESLQGRILLFESDDQLTPSSSWLCSVIQLMETIPLPERDDSDAEHEAEARTQATRKPSNDPSSSPSEME